MFKLGLLDPISCDTQQVLAEYPLGVMGKRKHNGKLYAF
jgi:hypothetical protein